MDAYAPSPFLIFVIAVFVLALIIVYSGVKTVPQAEEWTIERFGRYMRTLTPGLNLIVPFVDRIGAKLSMRETVIEVPSQDVITYDNASVKADAVVFFQVIDAAKAAYEVQDLRQSVINLSMTCCRSATTSTSVCCA